MKKGLLLFSFLLTIVIGTSQDIEGVWVTIDDDGVTKKSELLIWREGSSYKGKIVDIYNQDNKKSRCTECSASDPRYNKKVLGMVILENLQKVEDNLWDDGEILDPQDGSVYDCKMWLGDNGKLNVRGYLGFSIIGRTQEWIRK